MPRTYLCFDAKLNKTYKGLILKARDIFKNYFMNGRTLLFTEKFNYPNLKIPNHKNLNNALSKLFFCKISLKS